MSLRKFRSLISTLKAIRSSGACTVDREELERAERAKTLAERHNRLIVIIRQMLVEAKVSIKLPSEVALEDEDMPASTFAGRMKKFEQILLDLLRQRGHEQKEDAIMQTGKNEQKLRGGLGTDADPELKPLFVPPKGKEEGASPELENRERAHMAGRCVALYYRLREHASGQCPDLGTAKVERRLFLARSDEELNKLHQLLDGRCKQYAPVVYKSLVERVLKALPRAGELGLADNQRQFVADLRAMDSAYQKENLIRSQSRQFVRDFLAACESAAVDEAIGALLQSPSQPSPVPTLRPIQAIDQEANESPGEFENGQEPVQGKEEHLPPVVAVDNPEINPAKETSAMASAESAPDDSTVVALLKEQLNSVKDDLKKAERERDICRDKARDYDSLKDMWERDHPEAAGKPQLDAGGLTILFKRLQEMVPQSKVEEARAECPKAVSEKLATFEKEKKKLEDDLKLAQRRWWMPWALGISAAIHIIALIDFLVWKFGG